MTQEEKIRAGQAVRVLRQAAGLRQSELAASCHVSRQRIHDVEAGRKSIGHLADVIAAVIAPRIRATEAEVRQLLLPGVANGSPRTLVSESSA